MADKIKRRLALTRWEISTIAICASNATHHAAPGLAAMNWWDWFWVITGPIYIIGSMFWPPSIRCDFKGRNELGGLAVAEPTGE